MSLRRTATRPSATPPRDRRLARRAALARAGAALFGVALLSSGAACGGDAEGGEERLSFAFVTNGVDPFWTIASAGVKDAAAELGVECDVRMPEDGLAATQKRIVEDMLARGVDGIAISPVDGENMASLIDEAAALTHVITQDSDAPGSDRRCFVGADNYVAGRECGKLVKEALPEGGSVMMFVKGVEQDNARLRRQGVIDELLDRSFDPTRFDPPGAELEGDRYRILGTRNDGFDKARAKANAEDALARHPDLGAMIGLLLPCGLSRSPISRGGLLHDG